jgi:hypothetical protein
VLAAAFPGSTSFEVPSAGDGPSSAGALTISGGGCSGAFAVWSSAAEGWSALGASGLPLSALDSLISLMTLPAQSV